MANLSQIEMAKFETLLAMASGHVLNFTNQAFQRFISGTVGLNIYSLKYELYGQSKAKRLRAFWETEGDITVGKLLEELIKYYQTQVELGNDEVKKVSEKVVQDCLESAYRLQGKKGNSGLASNIDDFLTKELDETPLDSLKLPATVIPILNQRIEEIKKCIKLKAPLAVIFLSGSVLEGILLNLATQNPSKFNQAKSAMKDKSNKVKPFPEWPLSALIDVAYELKYLGLDVKKHSHSLRDFRNYIHPFEQMSSGFDPDFHTAEIAWKVLKAAMHSILKTV